MDPKWDEINWNSIRFLKPAGWQITNIGRNYLMLGTHGGPKMEITWESSPKSVSPRIGVKQLQTRILKRHLATATAWNPCPSWVQALSSYQTSGFSWNNSTHTGHGLILSCAFCHRTSLIQFYQTHPADDHFEAIVPRLLSSFRDHPEDDRLQWAVFDIRATLPANFQIKTYRFLPGFITICFCSKNEQITLYRWSPASVLLAGRKLSEFAGTLRFYPGDASEKMWDENRIEWEYHRSYGIWTRFLSRLSVGISHQRFLIRHVPEKNRILAVNAESKQPIDPSLFEQISLDYEITPA